MQLATANSLGDSMNLRELEIGRSAVIESVGGSGSLRQHFLDMGLIPGTKVTLNKYAPMGDPMELDVSGYTLTLRLAEAEQIEVKPITQDVADELAKERKERNESYEHPGLGEGGRFHDKASENPLPKGTEITFALVGNQNCGKTTLFNQLTGANQHVGNFPGVTVDKKEGTIKGYPETLVTDLPGIYSLSPYTSEEIVSRNFVLKDKPTGIINIVDATNIERNLYLTMQLIELDVPMVVALNMMDELRGNGGSIDINAMETLLGVPVVPIVASKHEGIDELVSHAIHVAKYQEKPMPQDFCDKSANGGAVHRCLHSIMSAIEDHAINANIPIRFAASKVCEGDKLIIESLGLEQNEIELLEHTVSQMESERGLDASAAIADMHYAFIRNVCDISVVKPKESKELIRSRKIDKILTGRFTAIPAFILIMGAIFYLTFGLIGAWLQDLVASGITSLTAAVDAALTSAGVAAWLHSLIINGIFNGVGSVLSFLPIIVVLFLFLSLLEDSGYMARVAFVMDKLLRRIGLSGRSIVPLIIGFGCLVPAVMASRTLPSERDRKMTILLTPFMSCSAKLPIYGFFCAAFFPDHAALIMIGLYVLSILVGIVFAYISKKTRLSGEAVPFVMELPNYRLPGIKNVAKLLWEKAKDFLQKAFTIIFVASIVVWFLQSFDFSLSMVSDSSQSILAKISGFIAPAFAPFGCGRWQIVVALVTGILAKESVVSSLQVLFASTAVTAIMEPRAAAALLVFCLIYSPCVAAIAAIRRELGGRSAIFVVLFQTALAWALAELTYLIIGIF